MTPNEESGYALLAAFEDRMARRDNAAEWRMRLCGMGDRADAETAQDLAYRAMRMWRGEQVPGEVQPVLFNNDKEGV